MRTLKRACLTSLICFSLTASMQAAGGPVALEVDLQSAGQAVSANALGLSYETSILSKHGDGARYFRPDNKALLAVFRTLGVRNLRIGGNSVDDPKVPLPTLDDVRALFQFARKAGVKVIYSVRLQEGDPASAAQFARLIHREFRDELESFAIGNEPSYYKDYAVYSARWASIRDAIVREFPGAKFSGPDQNPDPELVAHLVRDFGTPEGRLVQVTQHSYPFGCSYKNPKDGWKDVRTLIPVDTAEARKKMLWETPYGTYEDILKGVTKAVAGSPLSFRLTETNSFWFSGLAGASDSYASALWAVDYLHWWMSHGAAGLNFHTGNRTGGAINLPCRYAAFVSAGDGYEIRPLAYGMKLFSLMDEGRYVNVKVDGSSAQEFPVYAVLKEDKLHILMINRHASNTGTGVTLKLKAARPVSIKAVRRIDLTSQAPMVEPGVGLPTLGGAVIDPNGTWKGRWSKLGRDQVTGNEVTLQLAPISAAVLEISLN